MYLYQRRLHPDDDDVKSAKVAELTRRAARFGIRVAFEGADPAGIRRLRHRACDGHGRWPDNSVARPRLTTARDFASLLPLTLTLKDYAATEKISDLPKKLATQDAPPGYQPSAGDIAYYAPWDNLALFHKDFEYSAGLVRLGIIESGVEVLRPPGPLKARIEQLKEE